jgi:predicted 3-demethylubiquinone-9 3-methyltransferase (glyoxalase superfamily)
MKKIVPHLWFDDSAEKAARFYVSIFSGLDKMNIGENTAIKKISLYRKSSAESAGKAEGSVMTVEFKLGGQDFVALNGGPYFKFTPAISFLVNCETQKEIDELWEKLTDGGQEEQCGWLRDKFGMSWQIVPEILEELMSEADEKRLEKLMSTMLKMKKLDIGLLKQAGQEEEPMP